MSRTNHAKAEHEARTAREAKQYAQKIAERDARRQCEQSVREYYAGADYVWFSVPEYFAFLPIAVAA